MFNFYLFLKSQILIIPCPMNFKSIAAFFFFSKAQRKGILFLFLIVIALQFVLFFVDFSLFSPKSNEKFKDEWLAVQTEINQLKKDKIHFSPKIYPFNPNFITDYKGYKLGMTVEEIDRLLAFRKENKYVNSADDFQKVTQISDSLLQKIAPFFKFPDWVNHKKESYGFEAKSKVDYPKKETIIKKDLNIATSEDLIKIYGIGENLAQKILMFKEKFGGFVAMEQLDEIWGLSADVKLNIQKHFSISVPSNLKKIAINSASIKELSQFPYFNYALAKQIVIYRSMNGDIQNEIELSKIKGFPVDKAKIIGLYLDF